MKCFYHTDMDGYCSAAIVYKYFMRDRNLFKDRGEEVTFVPMNYNIDFPMDTIKKDELVVIVDFSLQKAGEMDKLMSITDNIVWIDHHKTAIEKHKDIEGIIKGIRRDGTAACELTWEYFYGKEEHIPKVVRLIGDYDVWKFEFGDDTRKFQLGVRLFDVSPESKEWDNWFFTMDPKYVIEKGDTILTYKTNSNESMVKAWSYYVDFEGYRCIVCNQGSTSSQLFDSIPEETYDIMIPYIFDGKQYTVSLYSTRDDIDCSQIAVKHGGGGHKGAAGFQCKELPFKEV